VNVNTIVLGQPDSYYVDLMNSLTAHAAMTSEVSGRGRASSAALENLKHWSSHLHRR
jgi:hypothetical protein